jgi:hypothetical protein
MGKTIGLVLLLAACSVAPAFAQGATADAGQQRVRASRERIVASPAPRQEEENPAPGCASWLSAVFGWSTAAGCACAGQQCSRSLMLGVGY